jgi:hypothetical protein
MRLYPHVALPPDAVEQWNKVLMPQINMALRHFYRKHPESVEISLESIGDSPQRTTPTVLVVCTSVSKVRAILKKQLGILFDGTAGFGLKVCRGQVLRSRNRGVGRSMVKRDTNADADEISAANPDYQERPQNGASIGAWIGDRHLPPVSFGGLIVVDDKPYGMTVHHMLDDPDQDQSVPAGAGAGAGNEVVPRSMARGEVVTDLAAWYAEQYQTVDDEADNSSGTEDFACEFSDTDSEAFSESDITSEASDDEQDEETYHEGEPGDIPGVEPGCGDGYIVTQPALDDVEDGFYPSPETQDEDHLDTYSLGEVYASSGIRRRAEHGLIHEIDWALFEFQDERQPDENFVPWINAAPAETPRQTGGGSGRSPTVPAWHPTTVTPASSLPGLEVQCMARSSGLQTGLILPALTSVKIFGRKSPSHTYQISGTPSAPGAGEKRKRALPMGVPGDSGAWIVDRNHGHLCGHVLAWSQRKRVAYICPMDVLLKDILETLEASEVRLPGGDAAVVTGNYKTPVGTLREVSDEGWEAGDEREIKAGFMTSASQRSRPSQREARVLADAGIRKDVDDGEDDDSYDEGVEVEIANEMKKLHLSGMALEDLHLDRMPVK